MADMLIRDVPDDVIAALDAHAARLGLSRSEYVHRGWHRTSVRRESRSRSRIWRASPAPSAIWLTLT